MSLHILRSIQSTLKTNLIPYITHVIPFQYIYANIAYTKYCDDINKLNYNTTYPNTTDYKMVRLYEITIAESMSIHVWKHILTECLAYICDTLFEIHGSKCISPNGTIYNYYMCSMLLCCPPTYPHIPTHANDALNNIQYGDKLCFYLLYRTEPLTQFEQKINTCNCGITCIVACLFAGIIAIVV